MSLLLEIVFLMFPAWLSAGLFTRSLAIGHFCLYPVFSSVKWAQVPCEVQCHGYLCTHVVTHVAGP